MMLSKIVERIFFSRGVISPSFMASTNSNVVSDEGINQSNLVAEGMKVGIELINEILQHN